MKFAIAWGVIVVLAVAGALTFQSPIVGGSILVGGLVATIAGKKHLR